MLSFKHVNTISSGVVAPASGGAIFWVANVNTGSGTAVLKVYNNTSAVAADLVASIDCTAIASLWYGVYCPKGIFYDLSGGAADVTIGYA